VSTTCEVKSDEMINDFSVPVVIGKERLGTVRLGVSHKRIGGAVDRLLWTIFIATTISIVIAALLGTMLARTTTKRIELLQRSAEEIVHGNLDFQTLPSAKLSCWKFMGCDKTNCPAHGDSRYQGEKEGVMVSVADTGSGIPPELCVSVLL
jgi:two-component system, NtrC family, sensor kinase